MADTEDDAAADARDRAEGRAGAAGSTDGVSAGNEAGAGNGVEHGGDGGLAPRQLATFFALNEAVSLLQHAVEQQLRAEGDISFVQFQLLARLADAKGQLTMTELADGVVYSRSGLTYQAGLLEKAGLITRGPSPDDERATLVTITEAGRARVARVLPGHVQVARRLLFEPLDEEDVERLGDVMTRVRDHMRAQPPRSAAPRPRSRGAAGPARS